MEFDFVVRSRRSIRKYKPDPVPGEALLQIIEAARLAPSGLNVQPARYVVVTGEEARKKISAATPSMFVAEAPALILCCLDTAAFGTMPERMRELVETGALVSTRMESTYSLVSDISETDLKMNLYLNAGLAMEHLLLKATDLGLGSCVIGVFDEKAVKAAAGLDDRYLVSALVTIGYPAQNPSARPRLPMEDILLKTI